MEKEIQYGLLGEKLDHSYSKFIHGALGNESYELIALPRDELYSLMRSRRFKGLNVTIPYKLEVIPFCDALTPEARAVGAVNTLYFEGERLIGHNTDLYGFIYMADRVGIGLRGRRVLILGSGGTSRTARAAAEKLGAAEIVTVSRKGPVRYKNLWEYAGFDVLINTTPVGMYPENGKIPVSLRGFKNLSGVIDVIYNPLKTALLFEADSLGIPFTNGLPMLAAQAAPAHALFTGRDVLPGEIEKTIRLAEGKMKNLVLIGMPGCGKSAVGRALAEALSRDFLDTDELAAAMAGMDIPAYFERFGEDAFREIEAAAAARAGRASGAVIATGGGIVTRPENRAALSQNGAVIFLERSLSRLAAEGRPVTARDGIAAIYQKRLPLYREFCDIRVSNEGEISKTVSEIIEKTGAV